MKPNTVILLLSGGALCTLLLAAAPARAGCPAYVKGAVGGDYTDADDRKDLGVVEGHHFTPQVEQLQRGKTGWIGGDIAYTLDHFPNHHRALSSMARLALRDKTAQPLGARYSLPCYFDRAIRLRPDDAKVRAIFGGYLLALGQTEEALEQLGEAARLEPENGTAQYNLGLLHLKRRNYPAALAAAHKAYALGFPLPGLKNKLQAAGQWRPAPQPEAKTEAVAE